MIKHIWSVLCRRGIIDRATNSLTISEVLEELRVDIKIEKKNENNLNSINIPLEFEVVSLWLKEGSITTHLRADSEVEIVNPEGKQIKTFHQEVNMPPNMKRLRTIFRIMGFVIENPGQYILRVNLKEEGQKMFKTVAELPIEVVLNKEIVEELPKT